MARLMWNTQLAVVYSELRFHALSFTNTGGSLTTNIGVDALSICSTPIALARDGTSALCRNSTSASMMVVLPSVPSDPLSPWVQGQTLLAPSSLGAVAAYDNELGIAVVGHTSNDDLGSYAGAACVRFWFVLAACSFAAHSRTVHTMPLG